MREGDTHPIAAGQFFNLTAKVDFRKSQPHEDAFGFVFWIEISMGGVQHGFARDGFEFLREIADAETRTLPDLPLVRRLFLEDHSEEGGLAGAIGADQPNPRTRAEMCRRTLKQNSRGILFIDRLDLEHEMFCEPGRLCVSGGADGHSVIRGGYRGSRNPRG